ALLIIVVVVTVVVVVVAVVVVGVVTVVVIGVVTVVVIVVVVVVMVVVVVVTIVVVVVIGRPYPTVPGQMANPIAVTTPSIGLACVLPLNRLVLIIPGKIVILSFPFCLTIISGKPPIYFSTLSISSGNILETSNLGLLKSSTIRPPHRCP
ncbi:hypothetical protein Tco_1540950, partial [Tanacetum coccineum]